MSESFAPPGGASPPGPSDRRTFIRYATDWKTFCQHGAEARLDLFWRIAVVHDVSPGGLALVLNLKYEPGTELTVELPTRTDFRLHRARVVHSREQGPGSWLTGCALAEPLSDEDVEMVRTA